MSLSTDQSVPENKRKEKKDEAMNILKQGIVANPARFVRLSPDDIILTVSFKVSS